MNKRLLIVSGIGAALYFASRLAHSEEDIAVQEPGLLESFSEIFTPMNDIQAEIENALANQNVLAVLDMLAYSEGTSGPDGYRTLFGGGLFDSYADHPRVIVAAPLGGSMIHSSAAGRYQFLRKTWDDVAPKIGATDFSPYWQDRAAVYLIRRRGALEAIMQGRLYEALNLMRKEWASLPGAGYGQPEKRADALAQVYANAGGFIA